MEVGALGTLTRLFSSAPPGIYKGHCFRINHFPEDNDYDHDSSEYLLRECQDPASPCVGWGTVGRQALEKGWAPWVQRGQPLGAPNTPL